jgi:hypothetical protein
MNRLQLELDRLYGLGAGGADAGPAPLRVLVLELAMPAGWAELSAVWKGVQSELELPAPAIAVSGVDGLQLWFSLASPIPRGDGLRFLEGLRARYLAQLGAAQVRLVAAPSPVAPPVERSPGCWSAFVSSDLASVFADSPWLDVPPGDEGQAALLRALEPIRSADFESALARLDAIGRDASVDPATPASPGAAAAHSPAPADADPVRFLTRVMNDEAAPLALRVEAAKALLPHAGRSKDGTCA